jgi:hypothetical protein
MSRSSECLTLLDIKNNDVLSNRIKGTRVRLDTRIHTLSLSRRKRLMYVYNDFMLCFVYET